MPRTPFDSGRSSRAGKPPPRPAAAAAPLRSITTFNNNAAMVDSPSVESRESPPEERSRVPAPVQTPERTGAIAPNRSNSRTPRSPTTCEEEATAPFHQRSGSSFLSTRASVRARPGFESGEPVPPVSAYHQHEQGQAPPPPPAIQGYPSHTLDAYQPPPPPPPPPPSEAGFGISLNTQPAHQSDRTQVSNGTHDKENSLGRTRTVARQPAVSRPPLAAFNPTAGVASAALAQQDLQAVGQEQLRLQTELKTAKHLLVTEKQRLEEETGRLSTKHQGPPAYEEPGNFEKRREMKHREDSPKTVNATAEENPRRKLSVYDPEDDCKYEPF